MKYIIHGGALNSPARQADVLLSAKAIRVRYCTGRMLASGATELQLNFMIS